MAPSRPPEHVEPFEAETVPERQPAGTGTVGLALDEPGPPGLTGVRP